MDPARRWVSQGDGFAGTVEGVLPGPCRLEGWPAGAEVDLGRWRGCLAGGAIGDALGRPAEGRDRRWVAEEYGRLVDFQPWWGWRSGPVGTVTDDTQLTMLLAGSLVACGGVDLGDVSARLVAWLADARGAGVATMAAVGRLAGGVGWVESGEDSDGNGAAMRVAPVGLVYSHDVDELRRAAVLSSFPTHRGRCGLVGTVAQAVAVALAAATPAGSLDPWSFVGTVRDAISDLYDPGVIERGPAGRRVTVSEVIGRVPGLLGEAPEVVFDEFFNGALLTETLPCAFWCFLDSPDDPERVIATAVSGGRDADTVAAMAGSLAGAYCGVDALPGRWLGDVEYAEHIDELSVRLADLAGRLRSR